MNAPNPNLTLHSQIKVRGYLDPSWQEWFDRLVMNYKPDQDMTELTGDLPDQAALLGILNRLNHMNILILSVTQTPIEQASHASTGSSI